MTAPTARQLARMAERHPGTPLSVRLAASRWLEDDDVLRACESPYAHEDEMQSAVESVRYGWAVRRCGYVGQEAAA
jgi:hypothetical protein